MKLFLALLLVAGNMPPLPKSAEIVPVPAEQRDSGIPIGNVKVTFTDGHTEKWTKLGRAELTGVSSSGMVGWLFFTQRGYEQRNYPMFETLRVCWPDEHHRDFQASAPYSYIEAWDFADNDTAVVFKSRGWHGPADYSKFDLHTGKLIDHAHGKLGDDLPAWARLLSD